MKVPHYRRNLDQGFENETPKSILTNVFTAGLLRLTTGPEELPTNGDLFREVDYLFELIKRLED